MLNLGARPEDADKEGGRYVDYFPFAEFKSLDTRPHDHRDYIQGDLTDKSLPHGPFDLVLAMSVIEHIDRPWLAASTITNLIAPGGYLYVAMPWFYPTHEGSDFGDHCRARPSGIQILFDELEMIKTEYYPTALRVVSDRRTYWNKQNSTSVGASILLRKPSV